MPFAGLGRGLKSAPAPWSHIRSQPRDFLDVKEYLPKDGEGYWGLEDPSKMSAAAVKACLQHWLDRQSNGEIPLEFSHFLTFDGRLVVANPLSAAPMAVAPDGKAPRKRRQKDVEGHSTDDSEADESDPPKRKQKRKAKKPKKVQKKTQSSGDVTSQPAEPRPREMESSNDDGENDGSPRPRHNGNQNQIEAQPPQASSLSKERTPLFLRSDSEEEPTLLDRNKRRNEKAPRHPSPYEDHEDSFDYSSLDPELLAISRAMQLSREEAAVANSTTQGEASSNDLVQIQPTTGEVEAIEGITGPNEVPPSGPISELQVAALLAKYPEATREKALKLGISSSLLAQTPVLLSMVHNIVEATPSTIPTPQVSQTSQQRGRASNQKDIGSPSAPQGTVRSVIDPAAAAALDTARVQLAAAADEITKLTLALASQKEKGPNIKNAPAIGKVTFLFVFPPSY